MGGCQELGKEVEEQGHTRCSSVEEILCAGAEICTIVLPNVVLGT